MKMQQGAVDEMLAEINKAPPLERAEALGIACLFFAENMARAAHALHELESDQALSAAERALVHNQLQTTVNECVALFDAARPEGSLALADILAEDSTNG